MARRARGRLRCRDSRRSLSGPAAGSLSGLAAGGCMWPAWNHAALGKKAPLSGTRALAARIAATVHHAPLCAAAHHTVGNMRQATWNARPACGALHARAWRWPAAARLEGAAGLRSRTHASGGRPSPPVTGNYGSRPLSLPPRARHARARTGAHGAGSQCQGAPQPGRRVGHRNGWPRPGRR